MHPRPQWEGEKSSEKQAHIRSVKKEWQSTCTDMLKTAMKHAHINNATHRWQSRAAKHTRMPNKVAKDTHTSRQQDKCRSSIRQSVKHGYQWHKQSTKKHPRASQWADNQNSTQENRQKHTVKPFSRVRQQLIWPTLLKLVRRHCGIIKYNSQLQKPGCSDLEIPLPCLSSLFLSVTVIIVALGYGRPDGMKEFMPGVLVANWSFMFHYYCHRSLSPTLQLVNTYPYMYTFIHSLLYPRQWQYIWNGCQPRNWCNRTHTTANKKCPKRRSLPGQGHSDVGYAQHRESLATRAYKNRVREPLIGWTPMTARKSAADLEQVSPPPPISLSKQGEKWPMSGFHTNCTEHTIWFIAINACQAAS